MQTDNRFFDDLARVAGGALGSFQAARQEIEGMFRQQLQRILNDMDLVPREEFEVVKEMAQAARLENEQLARRLEALEAAAAATPKARKAATAKGKASGGAAAKAPDKP
ncbi:accessory factor UbiK family protein [Oceanibacterium hippocampi]|uniref:Membrane fusogenic activity n=1 Tax=Oceanibacterium hippocampi TaxID=745714 RepID=A0A1Y5TZK9_9PROT|nr:accessory factor UbiK family protein [Oceanibacterium hippocampi]SLN74507.1 Membrane fusogenic activity [Oceanibacterium hippocampi]